MRQYLITEQFKTTIIILSTCKGLNKTKFLYTINNLYSNTIHSVKTTTMLHLRSIFLLFALPLTLTHDLDIQSPLAMVLTYGQPKINAKGRLVKNRVETDGRTDTTDSITSR